ncbi:hypothetical protein IF2G_00034 [Cordyceps javanica]|nr:hypothetical protein IF2G_00034 [Cordyceps javanica]
MLEPSAICRQEHSDTGVSSCRGLAHLARTTFAVAARPFGGSREPDGPACLNSLPLLRAPCSVLIRRLAGSMGDGTVMISRPAAGGAGIIPPRSSPDQPMYRFQGGQIQALPALPLIYYTSWVHCVSGTRPAQSIYYSTALYTGAMLNPTCIPTNGATSSPCPNQDQTMKSRRVGAP